MEVKSHITFIIPAYLKTKKDKDALIETIRKISTIASDILVISQGLDPKIDLKYVRNFHSNKALGKWGAISKAKDFLLKEYVFIHDADNPFKEYSYKNIKYFNGNMIIDRDKILLYAPDEMTKNSRKYIELFLNKYSVPEEDMNHDLQSGSLIIESDQFRSFDFEVTGQYGGELLVYHYLVKCKMPIGTLCMCVEKSPDRRKSNYSIADILDCVITKKLSNSKVKELCDLVITDYGRYLDCEDSFKAEILYMLNRYNFINHHL